LCHSSLSLRLLYSLWLYGFYSHSPMTGWCRSEPVPSVPPPFLSVSPSPYHFLPFLASFLHCPLHSFSCSLPLFLVYCICSGASCPRLLLVHTCCWWPTTIIIPALLLTDWDKCLWQSLQRFPISCRPHTYWLWPLHVQPNPITKQCQNPLSGLNFPHAPGHFTNHLPPLPKKPSDLQRHRWHLLKTNTQYPTIQWLSYHVPSLTILNYLAYSVCDTMIQPSQKVPKADIS